MDRFWNWLYSLYVGFRKAIGWYKVRELWISDVPIDQEHEFHLDSTNSGMTASSRLEFTKLLNLQRNMDWNDCWMERVKYIGHLGDWPTNQDLMPGILFHEAVNMNTKETVDGCFYLPSNILRADIDGEIHLYHENVDEIPTLCVIHIFDKEEDAKLDFDIKLEKIKRDCESLARLNDPNYQGAHHEYLRN